MNQLQLSAAARRYGKQRKQWPILVTDGTGSYDLMTTDEYEEHKRNCAALACEPQPILLTVGLHTLTKP